MLLAAAVTLLLHLVPSASALTLHPSLKPRWEAQMGVAEIAKRTAPPTPYNQSHFETGAPWKEGETYSWLVPDDDRWAGMAAVGDTARLRAALQRFKDGKNLTISCLGSSITRGGSVQPDGLTYPQWLELILRMEAPTKVLANAEDGSRLRIINGGSGGTTSSFASSCHRARIPQDTDIVLVEFAYDDMLPGAYISSPYNHPLRRSFERLLRKLLRYPNSPAVIILNANIWREMRGPEARADPDQGLYYKQNIERELWEFASYYRLPMISIKSAVHHLMRAGAPGFDVEWPRQYNTSLAGRAYFWDRGNPDGMTGLRAIGEITAQLFLNAADSIESHPLTKAEKAKVEAQIPMPMIPYNYEMMGDTCLLGEDFKDVVRPGAGWEWTDEGRNRWGFVSREVNSTLDIVINTELPAVLNTTRKALVRIGYLVSWRPMGMFHLACVSGCQCMEAFINAYNAKERVIMTTLHPMKVTQTKECTIRATVMEETASGGYKIKIVAVLVSEEPAEIAVKHESNDLLIGDGYIRSRPLKGPKALSTNNIVNMPIHDHLDMKSTIDLVASPPSPPKQQVMVLLPGQTEAVVVSGTMDQHLGMVSGAGQHQQIAQDKVQQGHH